MKIVKIIVIPAILAVLVYLIYVGIKDRNKPHSPLPEDGIKVIQLTPAK